MRRASACRGLIPIRRWFTSCNTRARRVSRRPDRHRLFRRCCRAGPPDRRGTLRHENNLRGQLRNFGCRSGSSAPSASGNGRAISFADLPAIAALQVRRDSPGWAGVKLRGRQDAGCPLAEAVAGAGPRHSKCAEACRRLLRCGSVKDQDQKPAE